MAQVKYCRQCSKQVVEQKVGRPRFFCSFECKNTFHNNARLNGVRALKLKYPKIYEELFVFSAA